MTAAPDGRTTPPTAMVEFLRCSGLMTGRGDARWTPLTGGVSSDLWRVDTVDLTACVKAALPTLRVADPWTAPVDRNAVEVAWLRFACEEAPGAVPRVLADDPHAGLFAMEFLDPGRHPVWKAELMAGRVDPAAARAVGDLVGRLAAASTRPERREMLARRFATDGNFHRLRIDPYLLATARRRPEVGDRLTELAERTQAMRVALVHGDVSPKNILLGPQGPVLLDAECAWWGDPAFDVAFCLNHLLLKAFAAEPGERADRAQRLSVAAAAWWSGYSGHVSWEPVADLQARAAELLPALLLARIDGKSPVEYVTADADRAMVRTFAAARLAANRGSGGLLDTFADWQRMFTT
jgi:aminoglycoside phosphotransferase (APT) family kinase protein